MTRAVSTRQLFNGHSLRKGDGFGEWKLDEEEEEEKEPKWCGRAGNGHWGKEEKWGTRCQRGNFWARGANAATFQWAKFAPGGSSERAASGCPMAAAWL